MREETYAIELTREQWKGIAVILGCACHCAAHPEENVAFWIKEVVRDYGHHVTAHEVKYRKLFGQPEAVNE